MQRDLNSLPKTRDRLRLTQYANTPSRAQPHGTIHDSIAHAKSVFKSWGGKKEEVRPQSADPYMGYRGGMGSLNAGLAALSVGAETGKQENATERSRSGTVDTSSKQSSPSKLPKPVDLGGSVAARTPSSVSRRRSGIPVYLTKEHSSPVKQEQSLTNPSAAWNTQGRLDQLVSDRVAKPLAMTDCKQDKTLVDFQTQIEESASGKAALEDQPSIRWRSCVPDQWCWHQWKHKKKRRTWEIQDTGDH